MFHFLRPEVQIYRSDMMLRICAFECISRKIRLYFLRGWRLEKNLHLLLLFSQSNREVETQTHTTDNLIKSRKTDRTPNRHRGRLTRRQAENISIVTSSKCVKETNDPIRPIISVSGDRESNQVHSAISLIRIFFFSDSACRHPVQSTPSHDGPWGNADGQRYFKLVPYSPNTHNAEIQTHSKTHTGTQTETRNTTRLRTVYMHTYRCALTTHILRH